MSSKRDYTVKESPRAKHVRLKLSLRDGLVIVVPEGFDHRRGAKSSFWFSRRKRCDA